MLKEMIDLGFHLYVSIMHTSSVGCVDASNYLDASTMIEIISAMHAIYRYQDQKRIQGGNN